MMANNQELLNNIEQIESQLQLHETTEEIPQQTHPVYSEEHKEKHREQFQKWLEEKYKSEVDNQGDDEAKKELKKTYVMHKAEYDRIKDVLTGVKK